MARQSLSCFITEFIPADREELIKEHLMYTPLEFITIALAISVFILSIRDLVHDMRKTGVMFEKVERDFWRKQNERR